MTDEETKAQYDTYIAPDIGAMQGAYQKSYGERGRERKNTL
jgi:hypothetical protein